MKPPSDFLRKRYARDIAATVNSMISGEQLLPDTIPDSEGGGRT